MALQNINVCVLNYGSGNVRSVYNLIASLTKDVVISNDLDDLQSATHLVLPGVGAFGAAMDKIKANLKLQELTKQVQVLKKPFLGICVGMQVLSRLGTEFGEHQGLNWIGGTVDKLETNGQPLPHVGWNDIRILKSSPLLSGLEKHNDFYFVHKYAFNPDNSEVILAKTSYGSDFCAAIQHENIYGVQFHPEKSQQAGRQLMANFLELT